VQEPERIHLAHAPTPLERAPRFSSEMTRTNVWIKRDDCTGLAFGGNKARRLEFLMAAARQAGADTVITFGGVQSNHARSTAAAARKLGMDCHLILAGSPPDDTTGNLLLDRVLGATFTFLSLAPQELTPRRVEDAFEAAEERLRAKNRRPFRIGPGGSTPLGVLGYRRAFDEILEQARGFGVTVTHLVTAFGTGGTLAGLVLGNILSGRPVSILGVSVAPPGMPDSIGVPPVRELVEQASALLGQRVTPDAGDINITYEYAGRAYALPTTEGNEAIRSLAHTEGVFLEPVYTGKAMAALIDLSRKGSFGLDDPDANVVFLHTGGTPALFAYSRSLAPS